MKITTRLLLTVTALTQLSLAALAAEEGFKSLFNGKDLTGWEGNTDLWSVKDGTITGVTLADPKLTHNTFLVYKGGDVADFELRLSYRIVAGNSGIQYRSKVHSQGAQGPIVGGYQADFEAGKTYSGILYEERGRGILAQRGQKTVIKEADGKTKVEVVGEIAKSDDIQAKIKHEDWNDYVVIAKGNHLQHFINGQQTVDVVDEQSDKGAKSGILALQIHVGPPMTVQFKNIRIKHFAATAKSDLETMQGNWVPVELVANGEAVGNDVLSSIKLAIKGKAYSVHTGDTDDGGSFELNDTPTPKQMDVKTKNGDAVSAIYEFSGDMMRVCYVLNNGERPTEFKSTAGSNRLVALYKRVP
jgi:uncharacterized protein (TIGR03067 family)